jgi:hypothetical protein
MDLAGAAKLAKAVEDKASGLLHPHVRIEAQPDLAMPDIANWNRDP